MEGRSEKKRLGVRHPKREGKRESNRRRSRYRRDTQPVGGGGRRVGGREVETWRDSKTLSPPSHPQTGDGRLGDKDTHAHHPTTTDYRHTYALMREGQRA